ncbi:mannosyltransferase putative-domain-containing protein [Pseudomassariella vexata]|uniref:Mannosyltransferase putative-domain-containing protein n=1 Tax=Pseudomassariella vexata TaxID=1141098 RepID=A0A1Y2EJ96_9PEZI|nr:mannosyltransferase putative-domain-containing protein [Pseudomassariella vexata]ORY71394.1 mannosyltransferase putative-domain-containing protein [Pseudomassariella vexata]
MRRALLTLPFALLLLLFLDQPSHYFPLPATTTTSSTTGSSSDGGLSSFFRPARPISGHAHLHSPTVQSFWRLLRDELFRLTPAVDPIHQPDDGKVTGEDQAPENLDNHPRPSLIYLDEITKTTLRTSHDAMLKFARGQASSELPFQVRTRGIVTTAGGSYFGMVVVSLRMLRSTGSKLPVTVFLDTHKDYDPLVCGEVLPDLNAECVVLSDLLDTAPPSTPLLRYQYKVFAILFSPFQEVLFLDADAFPAHNPDQLFDTQPYKSTGLVTWPDFWVSTASPLIFDITRVKAPPLAARKSSEAGILLYDKARHATDLLMALYYNFFGPDLYYPLLAQGAAGEGDKDTFLHAATVIGAEWYDVKSPVTVMGRWLNDTWHSFGMKQADPAEEWNINETSKLDPGKTLNDLHQSTLKTARPFFIHNNIVKFDIERILEPGSALFDINEAGHLQRVWGPQQDVIQDFGYDVEQVLWTELIVTACQLMTMRDCRRMKDLAAGVLAVP